MSTRGVKRRWVVIGTLACLSLGLLMSGGASAGTTDDPACPGPQVTNAPGLTTFTGHGSTPFTNAQSGGNGSGTLTWSLKGQITGSNPGIGDIQGFLNATIDWNQQGQPNTTFASDCMATVRGEVGHVFVSSMGDVSNFPAASATGNGSQVFASMNLDRVRPKVADLFFHIDFGDLCGAAAPGLNIIRPEAPAPGHKTGNGERHVSCA